MPPLKACTVTDYGNLFNQDSQERILDQREAASDPPLVIEEETDGRRSSPVWSTERRVHQTLEAPVRRLVIDAPLLDSRL
jgi:hypothetical protein